MSKLSFKAPLRSLYDAWTVAGVDQAQNEGEGLGHEAVGTRDASGHNQGGYSEGREAGRFQACGGGSTWRTADGVCLGERSRE